MRTQAAKSMALRRCVRTSDRLGFAACGLLTLLGMGGAWGRAAADTVGAAAPGAAGGTANSAGRAHGDSTGEAAAPVNDAAYGGRAVDLLPATPTRVRLKSATIQINDLPRDAAWEVVATYDLHNDTADAAALSLLFPEDKCAAGAECTESAGAFRALATQLDGKPVASRVTTPASTPWARHAGRVFQYDLRLQPGQRSRLVHQYRLDRSAGNDWTELRYVSSAGRWGGPIDAVDFKVRLVQPVLYVMHTPTYGLSRFAEAPAGAGRPSVVEIALGARSLAQRVDLSLVLPAASINHTAPDEGICTGMDGESAGAELRGMLREYSPRMLRACRNHVYALHGYPFRDPALRATYYGAPPKLPAWARPADYAIAARPENRNFQESWLSPGERSYVAAISELERTPAPPKSAKRP